MNVIEMLVDKFKSYININNRRKRILIYVLGGIVAGFVLLTTIVTLFPVTFIDREFSEEVQEHQYPVLDLLMKGISWPGSLPQSIVMVLTVSFMLVLSGLKREAVFVALTLLSGVISHFLKTLINRPRPTKDLVRIIENAKYQSFPSGHVMFYIIFFGFLIVVLYHLQMFTRLVRISLISSCSVMIIGIPFSRIYLGAHWFTDVLASVFLGSLALYILSYLYLKNSRN